jgi:hypothetical protein
MPLKSASWRPAAPQPPGTSPPQPSPEEQRAATLVELAALRVELAEIDKQQQQESAIMDNNNNPLGQLTPDEIEILRAHREKTGSAVANRQRFDQINAKPAGSWTTEDFAFMKDLMPFLLEGRLPF